MPHYPMEQQEEEDYFAPLGMPQTDFNSMIRRRNLADLTKQLIEQGRVTLPGVAGTLTVPINSAKLVKCENGVANIPEPLVADFEDIARRSSSFYCRGIDENSLRFATFFDKPGSRSRSIASESQSPTFVPGISRASSCIASLSNSSPPVTSSTATSVSSYNSGTAAPKAAYCPLRLYPSIPKTPKQQALISSFPATSWKSPSVDTFCSGTAAPKAEYYSLGNDPRYCKALRMPDAESHSLPTAGSIIKKVRASHRDQQQKKVHKHPASQALKEPELDLPATIAALMQNYEQRKKLQELQPPVDRIVELGRLRRAIKTLNLGFDDGIMLASDLTSIVPVPSLSGSQEKPEGYDENDLVETHEFFRRRLARTVRRRIEFLRGELRVGDALKIEHWYKDVVDLVGWRDEDESIISWSWLEKDGFF